MSSKCVKRTTLVLLLDAFSKTYLSKKYAPFLCNLSRDGLATYIEPLFAFKGIETTLFTGVWPCIHNIWTEFCSVNNQLSSRKEGVARKIRKMVDLLPNDEFRAKFGYAIERYAFRKPHTTPNLIPAKAMSFFQPSQQKKITDPGSVGQIKTIFDFFRKKGVRFVFIEPWIFGDQGVFNKAKKIVKDCDLFDFWYVKFNQLDHLGHKYGPSPSTFREQLNRVDRYVEEIIMPLEKKSPNLNVLVLADHGMSKVHKTVDMLRNLRQLKSRIYKDYVLFADSTMIRFWFYKKESKQEICKYLEQIKCGHILNDSEEKLLKIPQDKRYGEIKFVLDEGYIVHPCFFHSKSLVNGMHGYAYSKTPEALPILLMNNKLAESCQFNKQLNYTQIAQLILHSLLPEFSTCISGEQTD